MEKTMIIWRKKEKNTGIIHKSWEYVYGNSTKTW